MSECLLKALLNCKTIEELEDVVRNFIFQCNAWMCMIWDLFITKEDQALKT